MRASVTPLRIAWAVVSCALSALLVWLVLADDPLGGEPVAHIVLPPSSGMAELSGDQNPVDFRQGLEPDDEIETPPADMAAVEEAEPPAETVDPLDAQFDAMRDAEAVGDGALVPAPVASVTDAGTQGPLPRISASGDTPADVYARPMSALEADPDTVKVAVLVGGLGLSVTGTAEAINTLPQQVTFGFAPYAQNLQDWVDRARQAGHEVMLHLPMEPYDYPDNDPGPHTLLTTLAPPENIRRLEWLLSRTTGYFGVTNYMGAKLTAAPDALRIILQQLNQRGLAYVEDGSSSRSTTSLVSRQLGLSATTADLVIDAVPSTDAIDTALQRLETMALETGIALGVATGLPVTVERIAQWARGLEARGIYLVPVSGTIALRENLS